MFDKLFNDVCGMFNVLHYFTIICFFAALWMLQWISRRLTVQQTHRLLMWIAVTVTVCEVIKITWRILQGQNPDSWVPLYYCSLFIFAVWMANVNHTALKKAGLAYMTMGGIVASVFFIIYPSTSLGMYPMLHPASIHSFLYHLVMCYTGIMLLWKGIYVPAKRDGLNYFIFVFVACIFAAIVNKIADTNCMFLTHPFGLPVLQPILECSKVIYMLLVAFAQSVLMFWLNYGLYSLLGSIRKNHTIIK